ncbi:hypothetical protein HYG77_32180 (plasmid) [Rhodococcus sp. ZPP]|uniref:DUF5994 family protein n=1 Tax=Rhodococcus sp. ZPP TaxID=2749906 RepID=UPI001AD889C7|nr:DUF5994 family protein [Rhodococcus sp. ZPP]QTJ70779.1 hypothetical protein HYG77_32180 [Rhodococcus sp. ZPP]
MRLTPAQSRGFVQGAWWPRSTRLTHELPALLTALSRRLGPIDRIIYDEKGWAPAPSSIHHAGNTVALRHSSDQSSNTLAVTGEKFGRLVLLVVPPYTDPILAYATMMTAASPRDVSTADELLAIGAREAEDRRLALLAQHRWESEGGALRHRGDTPAPPRRTGDRAGVRRS